MSPNVIEPRAASQGTNRILELLQESQSAAENSADLGMSAGGETQKISLNVIEFHEEHMMIYKNVMITFDKYTIYIYIYVNIYIYI